MVKFNAGCAQISGDLYSNSLPWAFVGQILETMLNLKLNFVNMTVWKLNISDTLIFPHHIIYIHTSVVACVFWIYWCVWIFFCCKGGTWASGDWRVFSVASRLPGLQSAPHTHQGGFHLVDGWVFWVESEFWYLGNWNLLKRKNVIV